MSYIIDALLVVALFFALRNAGKEHDKMTEEEKEFMQTW